MLLRQARLRRDVSYPVPGLTREHERRTGRRVPATEIRRAGRIGRYGRQRDDGVLRASDGRALAGVINVLDPDVIVLGGGLSNIERLYDERAALVEWTHFRGRRAVSPTRRARD